MMNRGALIRHQAMLIAVVLVGTFLAEGCESKPPSRLDSSGSRAGTTSVVPSASTRPPAAATGEFDFPVVPAWEREEARPLGHELGFSLGYNRRSSGGPLAVTVYIYKRGRSSIPAGASSELVVHELTESLAAMQDLARRRETYRTVGARHDDPWE